MTRDGRRGLSVAGQGSSAVGGGWAMGGDVILGVKERFWGARVSSEYCSQPCDVVHDCYNDG